MALPIPTRLRRALRLINRPGGDRQRLLTMTPDDLEDIALTRGALEAYLRRPAETPDVCCAV
ncbi:MAG: hypothetical protein AAF360_12055 [Pseudomonadota bacterium]